MLLKQLVFFNRTIPGKSLPLKKMYIMLSFVLLYTQSTSIISGDLSTMTSVQFPLFGGDFCTGTLALLADALRGH